MVAQASSMANNADNGSIAMYPCEQFDIVGAVVTVGGRAKQARALASGRAAEIARRRIAAPWLSQLTTNVLLPLVIVVTTAIAAVKHGPTRVYWSLGTFVAVFVIGLISYNKDRTSAAIRDEAIQSRTELATALNDTAQPLVVALGNVTAADSVDEAKENVAVLIDRAVSLAQTELARSSDSRTRSALYCIEGNRLVRRVYHGWNGADAPRREFVRGRSEHDDEVIRFVHGENALLVEDLENHPPPHFIDFRGRSYKSFVRCQCAGVIRALDC
jgi:hypothetical protein